MQKSKKTGIMTAAGIISIVAGGIMLPTNIIGFIVDFVKSFFSDSSAMSALLTMIAGLAIGVILLVMGIKMLTFVSRYKKIYREISTSARVNIQSLAQVMKRDVSSLASDLFSMVKRGWFEGAEIDLERKELVIDKSVPPAPLNERDRATVYEKKEKLSVIPIYMFGIVWLLYAQLLPLYRWFDFVIVLAVSLLISYGFTRIFPSKITLFEVPRTFKKEPVSKTGNPDLDEFLDTANEFTAELMRLELAISEEKVKSPLRELLKTSREIFNFIKEQPAKIREIRQFMNYYLPTTIKLLKNYEELSGQANKGENILSSMKKIEEVMQTITQAFNRELDNLFGDKAMDISSEIVVLQQLIDREGLEKDPFKMG